MNLTRNFAIEWLAKLRNFWLTKDIDGATSLFSKASFYQETPFMDSFRSFDKIKQEWKHIKDENINDISIELLALDEDTVIAHWILSQNDELYDGIYQIRFDDNLDCVFFKSWEMSRNVAAQ